MLSDEALKTLVTTPEEPRASEDDESLQGQLKKQDLEALERSKEVLENSPSVYNADVPSGPPSGSREDEDVAGGPESLRRKPFSKEK